MSAMASKSQRLLLSILLIWISIVSTSARPCKTLFISSYTFSLRQPQFHSSSGFVTIFAEVTQFYRVKGEAWIIEEEHQEQEQEQRRQYQEEASCQV
ncbi:hypothetical protein CsatB_022768 [Cannabis sativa]